jgi:hypothetical protein
MTPEEMEKVPNIEELASALRPNEPVRIYIPFN